MIGTNFRANTGSADVSIQTTDCYSKKTKQNGKYYFSIHDGATSKTIDDLQDEIDALDTTQNYKDCWSQSAPVTITLSNPDKASYSVVESYKFPDHTYFMRIKVQYGNLGSNITLQLTVSNATAYWIDDFDDNNMYSYRINLYNDNGVANLRAGNHSGSSEVYWRTVGVLGIW